MILLTNIRSIKTRWFNLSRKLEEYKVLGVKDYNAMVLSTVKDGSPDSRIVLLKELRKEGLVFYTNYGSAKGQSISANPQVNALFFWRSKSDKYVFADALRKFLR